ncbi:DoxX family protein [Williamsia sp. SKLECPSW1]
MTTLLDRLPTPAALRRRRTAQRDARIMGGALVGMGVLHFAVPAPFDSIVPPEIPGDARTLTYASGAAEMAIGAGLLYPRTRRTAATAAVALFVAVFPANVNTLRVFRGKPLLLAGAAARLPMQIPMITTALRIRRDS